MAKLDTFKIIAHKDTAADRIFRGEIEVSGVFTQDEWDRLTQLFVQLSREKRLMRLPSDRKTLDVGD